MPDTHEKFSPLTVALHWIIGITIICLLAAGLYIDELPRGPWRSTVIGWHKLAGTTVFMLAALRILWRWRNGLPYPASGYPAWQHALAVFSHILLLTASVAMPLSGAAMSYGGGHPVPILGITQIGPPAEKIAWLAGAGSFVHHWAGWGLIGLVCLHVLGALKHHMLDRDGTLRRMLGARIA